MVNKRKIFVFILLGMFLFSMVGVVRAANTTTKGTSLIDDVVNKFSGVNLSDDTLGFISKLLLMTLVVLLVYAIAGELPFLDGEGKDGVRWGVSIIVGVLSFMFVSTDYVMTILTTYEALGIALTTFIPLIILMVFMWQLKGKHLAVAKVVEKPIYSLFIVYIIYRIVTMRLEDNSLRYVYILTAVVAFVWMVIEKRAWRLFRKAKKEAGRERAEDAIDNAVSGVEEAGKFHKGAAAIRGL